MCYFLPLFSIVIYSPLLAVQPAAWNSQFAHQPTSVNVQSHILLPFLLPLVLLLISIIIIRPIMFPSFNICAPIVLAPAGWPSHCPIAYIINPIRPPLWPLYPFPNHPLILLTYYHQSPLPIVQYSSNSPLPSNLAVLIFAPAASRPPPSIHQHRLYTPSQAFCSWRHLLAPSANITCVRVVCPTLLPFLIRTSRWIGCHIVIIIKCCKFILAILNHYFVMNCNEEMQHKQINYIFIFIMQNCHCPIIKRHMNSTPLLSLPLFSFLTSFLIN
jgi:hypothetical protein